MTNGAESDEARPRRRGRKLVLGIVLILIGIGGLIFGFSMWVSGYTDLESPAKITAFISVFIGMAGVNLVIYKLPMGTRLLVLGVAVFLFFAPLIALLAATRNYNRSSRLRMIMAGMITYQSDNAGYFPFDERGPLHSLALLYPKYIDAPRAFQNVRITRLWRRRNEGPFFPADTPLAGCKCHYGYTWRVPLNPPEDFAIAADKPGAFKEGASVGYPNGSVTWQSSPFCSHDPNDNIFAAQPGWEADTDSYVRTSK